MPTFSTCQQRSQSASASSSFRVVPNSRVSCARPPLRVSLGTRIVTMIIFLPMSIPATRSQNSGSSSTSSIVISYDERAVNGRGRPQELRGKRKSDPRARSTSSQPSRTAPGAQAIQRGQARQDTTASAGGRDHPPLAQAPPDRKPAHARQPRHTAAATPARAGPQPRTAHFHAVTASRKGTRGYSGPSPAGAGRGWPGGLAYVACNMGFAPGRIAVHRTAGPSAPLTPWRQLLRIAPQPNGVVGWGGGPTGFWSGSVWCR